jgi:hypothetical protein
LIFQWVTAVWSKKFPALPQLAFRVVGEAPQRRFSCPFLLPRGGAPQIVKVRLCDTKRYSTYSVFRKDVIGAYSDSCCSGCFSLRLQRPGRATRPSTRSTRRNGESICKDKKLSSSKPLFHPPERSRKGRSVDGRVKPGQDGPSAKIRPRNLNRQLSLQAPCNPIFSRLERRRRKRHPASRGRAVYPAHAAWIAGTSRP